ncbi:FG-GAP repeat protein, partial [Oceanospirillum sp. HFRX-1_2]
PKATKTLQFRWDDVADETEYRLLENPDGSSGFEQIATITADSVSYDHVVSLPDRINAQYILQSCNAVGCSDSATVSVTTSLASAIGYFKSSNTDANDEFGGAISLSADGKTLAVGAVYEDSYAKGINGDESNNTVINSGAVYVFRQDAGNLWRPEAYIKASNTERDDEFGFALSLSGDGNTLAVGARFEDSNATGINGNHSDNSAGDSGAVYVFTRSGVTWSQEAYIKASNTGAKDEFGSALSLSGDGNTLAVGARYEDSNATGIDGNQGDNSLTTDAGAVYVFTRSGANWSQEAYIKASYTRRLGAENFGEAVSLSADGNTLAVGAPNEDSSASGINGVESSSPIPDSFDSGAVYVFTRSDTGWTQQVYIKASNRESSDNFGSAVSLSENGDTLAVGAFREGSNATGINGDQDDNSASSSGAVYVFTRSGSDWSKQAYIKASNTDAEDRFGHAVSLSADGNTLVVGATGESSNAKGINGDETDNSVTGLYAAYRAGAVYRFKRSEAGWVQQSYIKASNTGHDSAGLGTSVSLSEDGSVLAVGAKGERSNAYWINNDQTNNSAPSSGAVYLY